MHREPGVIVVYADLACPWAHLAVWRLHEARRAAGHDEDVRITQRAFPLELVNNRPTPKSTLDAEVALLAAHEPGPGWLRWAEPDHRYPVTVLLALEAVQAAGRQSARAEEQLDRALRLAFFGESRCIAMRHVVLEVAETCDDVDLAELEQDLDSGVARADVMAHWRGAQAAGVQGSPHVFAGDQSWFNPGVELHWDERQPYLDSDNPSIYADIVAAATRPS